LTLTHRSRSHFSPEFCSATSHSFAFTHTRLLSFFSPLLICTIYPLLSLVWTIIPWECTFQRPRWRNTLSLAADVVVMLLTLFVKSALSESPIVTCNPTCPNRTGPTVCDYYHTISGIRRWPACLPTAYFHCQCLRRDDNMLTVSPPLHKDFRARHLFPSSGDGWRCFAPPPLPTVQPAFHFLSSLLEQSVAVPTVIVPKIRPPMDPSLYGSLERIMALPYEVLDLIVSHVVDMQSGCSLALASPLFRKLTTRHLYNHVQLSTHSSVAAIARTLQDKPELGLSIRRLSLLCHRPQWVHMHTLGKALAEQGNGIIDLRVRFQSSDLHEAMPFLACFSPVTFEWVSLYLNGLRFERCLSDLTS